MTLQIQTPVWRVTRSINDLLDWNFRTRRDVLNRELSLEHTTPLATRCTNTANGGIDPAYLTSDQDPPGRDNGTYLLQHGDV